MTLAEKQQKSWVVYMIRSDDDQFYTGITTDISRRWREHNTSKLGARYFRGRKPKMLCLLENHADRSSASKREAAIKKLKRGDKERLLTSLDATQEAFLRDFNQLHAFATL